MSRPLESLENLLIISMMYARGRTPEEIHPKLKTSAVTHSVGSVRERCRNQDWIRSGGKYGRSNFRNDHYDIVCKLYPGQIKPKNELKKKRTTRSS
jgi:hypothetical protein